MLQPVMIGAVGGFERGADLEVREAARACFRARRAPPRRGATSASSEAANDALQQRDERAADAARRLHHLVVVERLVSTPAAMLVMHEMPSTSHAHVPRGDRLGHRGHADGVGAERAEGADLGRRLVARAVDARRRRRAARRRPRRAAASSASAAQPRANRPRVMSGKRGPNRSSFGPTSGLPPIRLMWSSMTISAPCPNSVLMPPAALVRIRRLTPSRAHHAHGEHDGRRSGALRRSARGPTSAATRLPARLRRRRGGRRGPTTRDCGQCGSVSYGTDHGVGQAVGEVAQARAEHDGHVGRRRRSGRARPPRPRRPARTRDALTAACPRWSR